MKKIILGGLAAGAVALGRGPEMKTSRLIAGLGCAALSAAGLLGAGICSAAPVRRSAMTSSSAAGPEHLVPQVRGRWRGPQLRRLQRSIDQLCRENAALKERIEHMEWER